jgi:hypothetical protein
VKIQDIIFLAFFAFLIYKKDSKLFLASGLVSILLSIPLFYLQIFFTAQHLLYYAFVFILSATLIMLFKERKI